MVDDEGGKTGTGRGYRARLIDARGTVVGTVDVMALTEGEALQQITALSLLHTVELWEGARMIIRMPRQSD